MKSVLFLSIVKIRSIPSENKGFKMLSKLGWSEGQALGKNSDGLLEPVSFFFGKQSLDELIFSSMCVFVFHRYK